MELLYFFLLFTGLFFLSRLLTTTISLVFFRVTKNYGFAVQLLAVLFLPGVIIHELAHWLVASLLFVPTGEIEFFPQIQGTNVKLGSVQIAKTDPFRRFFIGIAPIFFGLSVLLGIFWFISPTFSPITLKTIAFLYAVFEIGNTMFSSKKDLEGIVGFLVLTFFFVSLLYFLKVPLGSFLQSLLHFIATQQLIATLNIFFLVAIGLDALIIGAISFPMRVFKK